MARAAKPLPKTVAPPDTDEEAALTVACREAGVSQDVVSRAITAWIMERWRIEAGRRLPNAIHYDLKDAALTGIVTAALPLIGQALADLPPDVPFFQLSKDQVVRVLVTSIQIVREAEVWAKESPSVNALDDIIPF